MSFLQNISYHWTQQLDPRVVNLPLIASSYSVPLIVLAYLYFVLSYGPKFMKNRPPYTLKTFMKLYNIVQIFANAWLMYDHIDAGLFSTNLICPDFDYSYNDIPMRITRCCWYFFLLKILDYADTVVFVLRKKNNQVSGLHLYHHVSTLLLAWFGTRYYAVISFTLLTFTNCFVHTVMYTYYYLAACGPNIQKTVAPVKRWITILQMTQFVVLVLYVLHQFVLDCGVVYTWVSLLFIANLIMNFYMFYNFYQRTYNKVKKTH
ncbi:elongation of very long chain fatty acids protein AAEL008004 [Monomorium pharaonis]|uniref:elongation of very long chain fatty acids protein AAEL008004 n=1 Tax=Monomorium pharaonis TaxID=307658 RepID=UPI00063F9EA7|nr:elongation of very long chain fatty acids protein AAEL008004 [Monomorium pharaonis]